MNPGIQPVRESSKEKTLMMDWNIANELAQREREQYIEPLPLMERLTQFEARLIVSGVPNDAHQVLTRQAAMQAYEKLALYSKHTINEREWVIVGRRVERLEHVGEENEVAYYYVTFERLETFQQRMKVVQED